MSNKLNSYQVFALRFASMQLQKAGRYHRYATYGEPDQTVGLDFFFWLIRDRSRTILVDCGFHKERAGALGYAQKHDPLDLLARLDVKAEDVDEVIISHMHFDHIGNLDLFPNATFSVARAELDFWTGPFSGKPHLGVAGDPIEIEAVAALNRAGRVRLIDGAEQIVPGVGVTPVRGHTPGQLITEIATSTGRVVLASDAVHFYEEMERDRPFWLFCDLEGMFRGYDLLRELEARPDTTVVAGHDPDVMNRYAVVHQDCVDLTARIV